MLTQDAPRMSEDMVVQRIISGGQTGADLGGLMAGKRLGIETGGWAPRGWRTESGPSPALGETYGLVEHESDRYEERTADNVRDSDGTILFGRLSSSGSLLTEKWCRTLRRPMWLVPWSPLVSFSDYASRDWTPEDAVRDWIRRKKVRTLNVAGNRESANRGICEAVTEFLVRTLGETG